MPVVERLLEGVSLALVIANRRGTAGIARATVQDDAVDRALFVAHDLGHAVAFQAKCMPPPNEIDQSEFKRVERDGHGTPSARSFPLLIGSLVGVWLKDTCPEAVRERVLESWCPGTTHLAVAIMAKQQNHSQTFYSDCFLWERACPRWASS